MVQWRLQLIAIITIGYLGMARAEACEDLSLQQLILSDPVLKELYKKPRWGRLEDSKRRPDGAYAANALYEGEPSRHWYIEEQRYAVDQVEAGVLSQNPGEVENAFKVFDWGFQHQAPDGSFRGTKDAFHSTSFFVEATARALLLIQNENNLRYERLLAEYTPKVHEGARWMARRSVAQSGRKENQPFTHRRWLVAAALGETAKLTGDAQLAAEAKRYAEEGLRMQSPEGYNPERGGFDVNYNAVGLYFASQYDTTLSCEKDARLKEQIARMLELSLRWEATKVKADGDIETAGSTRVNKERNRRGQLKTASYSSVVRAFTFGATITGNGRWKEIAQNVARLRWRVHE